MNNLSASMPAPTPTPAARVKPEDFFSPEEWKCLSARSNWMGLLLVAHCWLVIAAAFAVGVMWPLTIPLAVMLVAIASWACSSSCMTRRTARCMPTGA